MDLSTSTIQKVTFDCIKTARSQCTQAGYERLLAEEGIERAM